MASDQDRPRFTSLVALDVNSVTRNGDTTLQVLTESQQRAASLSQWQPREAEPPSGAAERHGGRPYMLGPNAEPDQPGRDPAQEWETRNEADRERR